MTAKQMIDECYDLAKVLGNDTEDETKKELERRYKVIVVMLLARIFSFTRAFFFLLSPLAGFFLFLFFKALVMP